MKTPGLLAALGAALTFGIGSGGQELRWSPRRYYIKPVARFHSNQRQARKDARRRWAAGDRFAFSS